MECKKSLFTNFQKTYLMKTLKPAIYSGKVTHSRIRPRTHFLSYNVFSLLLDVNNLHSLNVNYKLLSYNRFNLFSIFDKDHGNQKNIKEWVVSELRNIGENDSTHQIFMLPSNTHNFPPCAFQFP